MNARPVHPAEAAGQPDHGEPPRQAEPAEASYGRARAPRPEPSAEDLDLLMGRLTRYARWLDAAVTVPGTSIRFGADAVLGLVPVVGDWVGVGLSSWIVASAWRAGIRRRTLARMVLNLAIEGTVGALPLVGDAFDVWFRANQRNVALLRRDALFGERRWGRRRRRRAGPPSAGVEDARTAEWTPGAP